MAGQTDLGKGVLISGIVAGILGVAASFILLPDVPQGKKYNIGGGSTDHIGKIAETGKKITIDIGVDKTGKTIDHMAHHAVVDVAPSKKQKRVSPLFEAPELWQVGIAAEKKNVIMDIFDEKAPQIHEGIDNAWFIQNGLADALCVSNGLTMDADEDGFTNKEEHDAGTNPSDKASAPALHGTNYVKLATVGSKTTSAYVQLDSNELEYVETADFVTIKVFAKKDDSQPVKALTKEVKVGETFGVTTNEPDRYKVVEIKTGAQGGIVALDTVNPQKGEEQGFMINHGKKNRKKIQDTKVTLVATAGPKKGENIEVLLGATFSIPGEDSTKCHVVATNNDGSSQIMIEGGKNEVTAPKAAN